MGHETIFKRGRPGSRMMFFRRYKPNGRQEKKRKSEDK